MPGLLGNFSRAARLAVENEPVTQELRALLAANYLSALLLLAIIGLMVFKPGAPHS